MRICGFQPIFENKNLKIYFQYKELVPQNIREKLESGNYQKFCPLKISGYTTILSQASKNNQLLKFTSCVNCNFHANKNITIVWEKFGVKKFSLKAGCDKN